jgi:hypothetical protein
MSLLPSISVIVASRQGYLSLDPHTIGMFPILRWLYSLFEGARRGPDGLCGGFRGSKNFTSVDKAGIARERFM